MTLDGRTRWYALIVLCLGTLMIVLDSTIVNVALPSIRSDLGFTETSLAWVVNAYLLTFGGFLLLGGRLGDLYGQRRLFLGGITLFTIASLACGLSTSQEQLIAARAVQGARRRGGLGGLAVAHDEPLHRARRARQGDGHLRLRRLRRRLDRRAARRHPHRRARLALDLPRQHPDRRSPWCCSRCGCCPAAAVSRPARKLDVAGAVTVTASLMLAVYAIVNGNQQGWLSARTLGLLAIAAALLGVFLLIESRVSSPLMPLGLITKRNVATANDGRRCCGPPRCSRGSSSPRSTCSSCSATARSRWASRSSPGNIVMGVLSVGVSARLVMRFGIKPPLVDRAARGVRRAAAGSRARPSTGTYVIDVLPSMILLGFGAGIAFNPVLLAAMSDVEPEESGLASGIVNTAFMMGGALGLAVLASARGLAHATRSPQRAWPTSRRSRAAITWPSSSARCSPSRRRRSAGCSCASRSPRARTAAWRSRRPSTRASPDMGRLVVTEFMTLDGVVEAPGGEFHPDGKTAWVVDYFTDEIGKFKLDELFATDALLLGRSTYDQFAKAWPTATDEQGFAERMNSLPKYVASTTLDDPLEWNSTLIKGDLGEVVSRLKDEYDRDILICGSADLVHTLIPLDVIDEYRLMLFPIVLGSGKRLFRTGSASLPLRLVHSVAFKAGVVVHSYEPDRSKP